VTSSGAPTRPPGPGGLRRELSLPRVAPATLWALGVLAALPALPLLPALVGDRTLFIRDIGMVWLPQAEAFVRTLAEGAWPLWDRWAGFGRPLLADPRAGVLYPPTWLNLLVPPALFYSLFVLGHLVLSAWGGFALGRRLGLSRGGALVAGGVWVASGPLPSLAPMGHHLAGAAWMPWVVLAGERALEAPGPRRILLWGLLLAVQLCAGSPDFSLVTGGVVVAQLLVHGLGARGGAPAVGRLLGPALLAAGFGAAVAAAQWLPTLDVVSRAARLGMGYEERTAWSLTLPRLAEIALPFSWADLPLPPAALERVVDGRAPWLFSVFLGAGGLGLAAAGLAAGSPRPRRLAAAWLVPGLLLALGRHSYVYDLVSGLPPVSLIRYPVKAMLAAALGWSLSCGAGFDAIAWGAPRARRVAGLVLGGLTLLAAVAGAALLAGRFDAGLTPPEGVAASAVTGPLGWRLLAAGAVAGIGAALCGLGSRAPLLLATALALLTGGPLLWHHRGLHPTAPRSLFAIRPEVLDVLDLPEGGRLYAYDYSQAVSESSPHAGYQAAYVLQRAPASFGNHAGVVLGAYAALTPPSAERWGIEGSYDLDILGFEPRPLDALSRRLRALESDPLAHRRLLAAGGVSRVVALVPAPWWEALEPVGERPGWFVQPVRVFAVPGARPRAWTASGVRVASGEAALRLLAAPDFDPARELILAEGPPRPAGPPPGRADVLERRGDRVVLRAELEHDGFVVMADAWDPGWHARVDGSPAPLLRANVAFRAVAVPAGRHRIEIVYRPAAVLVGLGVSGLALLAGVALAWRDRRG